MVVVVGGCNHLSRCGIDAGLIGALAPRTHVACTPHTAPLGVVGVVCVATCLGLL